LGADPDRFFIIYPGGNSFYIDDVIEDRINDLGKKVDQDKLEDIFWRFLHPEIRRVLEPFRSREKQHQAYRRKKGSPEDLAAEVHIFDKRRVHFLRFGQTDQGNISRLPQKMFGMLHDKSRDEIEQTLMDMERQLALILGRHAARRQAERVSG
jgi:hypothetical protein